MIVRELVARFGFQTDTSGLDKADRKLKQTKKEVDALDRLAGAKMPKMLSQMAAGLTVYGIGSQVKDAVDASNQFGEAMGKIQSLMPENIKRAQEYKTAILDLSTTFGTSADDLAATMYDLVSTFGDAADNVEKLQLITKMAVAGNTSARESMGLLTAITKSYGDESLETMKKVADLAAQTINYGVIEMPALTAGMRDAANMAATLGVNMEELFGVFASASAITGLGPEVGTQLQSVFRAMLDKSKPMAAAFKKAGFKGAADAIQKSGGLGPALVKLAAQTDGTEEGLNALFGRVEGMKLSMFLTGKGADQFKDKLRLMGQAAGATDAMFKGTTEGLAANAFQAKKTKAELEKLRVEVGDNLAGAWGDAMNKVALFVKVGSEGLHTVLVNAETDTKNVTTSVDDMAKSFRPAIQWMAKLALLADTTAGALGGIVDAADSVDEAVAGWAGELWGGMFGTGPAQLPQYMQDRIKARQKSQADRKARMLSLSEYVVDPDMAEAKASLREAEREIETRRGNIEVARRGLFGAIRSGDTTQATTNIGQLTVALEVPSNLSVNQLEHAVKQGVLLGTGQAAERARRDIPNRTDKSGVEGFGGAGTNSTMGGG